MVEVALGIDVGTGSTKAGLVDADGRLVAVARCGHPIVEPRPGWSESDPDAWLASTRSAVTDVLATVDGVGRIMAVGLSGQMHGIVVCDQAMVPLRPAVLWSDRRSQAHLDRLRDGLAPEDRAALANPIVAGMAGPSFAALADDEPAVIARVAKVVQPKDWVRYHLTGVVATDPSDASATLLWDAVADGWSSAACRAFGLAPELLPDVLASEATSGRVTATAGSELGLPAGIPVATGAADTAAALLGAGLAVGETQVSTGTGGQIARLVDAPVADRTGRTHLYRAAAADGRDRWYAMAAIQNAGVAIDWALGALRAGEAEVGDAVADTPIGSHDVVFLPYLTGERTPHLDPELSGAWDGLRPGTGRAALIRSVFEGVAFALADGLDALRACGHPIDRALLAGGGSTGAWWRQLLADALAIELVPHSAADASVRGAGILGWSSIGHPIDPASGIERRPAVAPHPDAIDAYSRARRRFNQALGAARPELGPSAGREGGGR